MYTGIERRESLRREQDRRWQETIDQIYKELEFMTGNADNTTGHIPEAINEVWIAVNQSTKSIICTSPSRRALIGYLKESLSFFNLVQENEFTVMGEARFRQSPETFHIEAHRYPLRVPTPLSSVHTEQKG